MTDDPLKLIERHRLRAPRITDDVLHVLGLIVVHWAHIEFDLQMILGIAAGVPYPMAQLTFQDPRTTDKLNLIRKALELRGVKPPSTKRLMEKLEIGQRDRNILVHSIWARHPETKELHVRIAAGNWGNDRHKGLHGMIGKTPRRVIHQAQPFTAKEGKEALRTILVAELLTVRLYHQVLRLVPLPPISLERPQPEERQKTPPRDKPQPQHQPSAD